MQIIIPMAGVGSRFQAAGYKDPKPLIEIDHKPLIEHIVNMFPNETDFLFICNTSHLAKTPLRQIINRLSPHSNIIEIPEHKLGPVYSIIQAKDYIKTNVPVIVSYCDINVHWDYENFVTKMKELSADAGFVAFKGFHPALLHKDLYATAKVDDLGNIIEVREKFSFTENKMDSWTSAGIHYFKNGVLIKKYFDMLISRKMLCNGEYFVSQVHNLLIDDKLKNILYPIDFFVSWGNPEDVREYLYWSKYFKQTD